MTTDPRIEAVARAIYADVNKGHARDKGWDEVRAHWQEDYRSNARAALAAADKAATITTVEELDALPVGSVAIGWSFDGGTPYLRCRTVRGQLVWGCVGQSDMFKSADLLKDSFKARVIHWGTE